MLTPEQIAKSGTEEAHQTAFFSWCAEQVHTGKYPELEWIFHIPNGGSRGNDARSAAIVGGKLKAAGVKAGVWDIFLPVPVPMFKTGGGVSNWYHGLFIEMKVGNNKLSDEQFKFAKFVGTKGYYLAVCYSWQEAIKAIEYYLGKR